MANQETQILDDIIVKSRRKMLTLGATSLAGMFLGGAAEAKAATATYTDIDILNFALNLEYLEASFYYQAAFGTTIDVANSASTAAGAPVIKLTGTVGTAGTVTGGSKVPFSTIQVASYAIETAVEEGKHVQLLLSAIPAAQAVALPAIDITGGDATRSFGKLGSVLSPAVAGFTPYDSDADFLIGAYIFEDVGVTAYHGAASLIVSGSILGTAAGILAVEAYHAGLVRTTINYLDPAGTSLVPITTSISNLRAALAKAALFGAAPSGTNTGYDGGGTNNLPDDYGLATTQVSLGGGANVTATNITDADPTNVIAFARNTTQVLNIVTGGGAVSADGKTVVSPAKGIFFPNGLNAGPNGFS